MKTPPRTGFRLLISAGLLVIGVVVGLIFENVWLGVLLAVIVWFGWFLGFVLSSINAERYVIQAVLSRPLNASLMIAWVLALFWHAQQGLQVVIEDYVHGRAEIPLQVFVKLLCSLGAIAAVIATLRIVFAA